MAFDQIPSSEPTPDEILAAKEEAETAPPELDASEAAAMEKLRERIRRDMRSEKPYLFAVFEEFRKHGEFHRDARGELHVNPPYRGFYTELSRRLATAPNTIKNRVFEAIRWYEWRGKFLLEQALKKASDRELKRRRKRP